MDLSQLLEDLHEIDERNLDPVFHAYDVREKVMDSNLNHEGWKAIMKAFENTESPVVTAGIAWALVQEANRDSSILKISDLFPFLNKCSVDERVSRNSTLSAIHLWIQRTPIREISDDTIHHILSVLKRVVSESEDSVSQGTVLEILYDVSFDLMEARRALPTKEIQAEIVQMLEQDLIKLSSVYEEERLEALNWIRELPEP